MRRYILFTSRDIGAAHQIKHIANVFKKKGFKISLIGSGPALEIFEEAGLNPTPFSINGRSFISEDTPLNLVDKLLESAYKAITKEKPDAVFCGLSSLDYGIDEAALYWAKRFKIPSFQFLDTWGTFNHLKDGYPDIYFGIDIATERLGYMGAKAPIRIVGSPKHFNYRYKRIGALRERTRKRMGLAGGDNLIGYFGQLPDLPGHTYNFERLVDAIKGYNKRYERGCRLLMRPHPAHIGKYRSYRSYLKKNRVEAIDGTNGISIEEILCACDIVATCFSTVAVDHAYLSCYSKDKIGTVLYLLCGRDIKRYLWENFGYWKTPLLDEGIGFFAVESNQLLHKLIDLLRNPLREEEYFEATKSLSMKNPHKKIIKIVSSFIN